MSGHPPPSPSLSGISLVDHLAIGVAVVDEQGRQVYVNPAFASMVEWPVEELVGASVPFVYWPPEEMARIDAAFRQTIAGTAPPAGFELRFQRRNGERFDVLLSIAPIQDGGRIVGWAASTTDIRQQKATEHALLDRQQRLDLAMSAGRLGSWEYRLDTGQVIWSSTLERLHGLEPGTFEGTFEAYQRDIHPDDVEYVLGTIAKSSHGDIPHHLEYRIVWPDGQIRWLEASGQLFAGTDGRPARMLGVCSDVTERKLADEAAFHAREEAERANRAKSDFLARMSHELRTPLNAIGGYLDLLDLGIDGPVNDRQRASFASIKRNQDHLLVLINDLLHFAQLEAGTLSFDFRPIVAAEFLERLRPMLGPHAHAGGLSFELEPGPAGARLVADEDRLHQILLNLIGNAAKFTPAGGRIRVWHDVEGDSVRIHVEDTGIGIPAERLEAIFDPFVQVGRAGALGGDTGIGLGLAISRDLARAMGGELTVQSRVGEGSTFSVSLPQAPPVVVP